MVVGLGIDLVDVARFRAAMRRHGERLEQRLFTAGELADCARRADRVLALAARFAAKEACVKALGTGEGIRLRDIEVVRSATGAPTLRLHGGVSALASRAGVARSHLSLTHEATAAAAVVVLETDGARTIPTDPSA